jgi:hypothetical protein
MSLNTFLHFFKLFELLIWTLLRAQVILICIFIITKKLLIGLSVLKILVFKHILFQFHLLFVFNFTDPLLVINVFLLLVYSHLVDPLVSRDLRHNAALVLDGVELDFANVVLRLVSETHDEAYYLNGF